MKWHLYRGKGKRRWKVNGIFYKTFDTWQGAIDWIDTQRHHEPTA